MVAAFDWNPWLGGLSESAIWGRDSFWDRAVGERGRRVARDRRHTWQIAQRLHAPLLRERRKRGTATIPAISAIDRPRVLHREIFLGTALLAAMVSHAD
jgi:hypothetical protein